MSRAIALPSRTTMRSDSGRDSNSVQLRPRKMMKSAGPPAANVPAPCKPHDVGRRRGDRLRPVADRMIEMQDARRHAVDLQHVEIAIGVERIARVVGGDRDRNAARLHLVQQRDAAPARRGAVVAAVLQIEIAHRQRHDRDAGRAPPCPACRAPAASGWRASEQQWPTRILPSKPLRSAASAIFFSEIAATSSVSSAWKSRSSPCSIAARTRGRAVRRDRASCR